MLATALEPLCLLYMDKVRVVFLSGYGAHARTRTRHGDLAAMHVPSIAVPCESEIVQVHEYGVKAMSMVRKSRSCTATVNCQTHDRTGASQVCTDGTRQSPSTLA